MVETKIDKLLKEKILSQELNIDIKDVVQLLDSDIDYEVDWNLRQLKIHKMNIIFDITEK